MNNNINMPSWKPRASIGFNHYDYSIVMIMNQDDIQQSVFSALKSVVAILS